MFKYGDMFIYVGKFNSDFPMEENTPLIFIKYEDDKFMYASQTGSKTRSVEALEYCRPYERD